MDEVRQQIGLTGADRGEKGARAAPGRHTGERRLLLVVGVVVAVLVALSAGGGRSWRWTGLGENNNLWDWLHLLLLPVALAMVPVWSRQHGGRYRAAWRAGLGALALAAAVVVVGGYLVPWRWTGFTGNTLWDWLELLLVPFALPLTVAVVLRSPDRSAS